MPRQVKGPAVISFWDDSKIWLGGDVPWDFGLRGIYTRHQRVRPMYAREMQEIYGCSTMTGQPWIGKERSFTHGRGTVLIHLNKIPCSFNRVVLFPFG